MLKFWTFMFTQMYSLLDSGFSFLLDKIPRVQTNCHVSGHSSLSNCLYCVHTLLENFLEFSDFITFLFSKSRFTKYINLYKHYLSISVWNYVTGVIWIFFIKKNSKITIVLFIFDKKVLILCSVSQGRYMTLALKAAFILLKRVSCCRPHRAREPPRTGTALCVSTLGESC